jgi:hypothetical protein
MASADFLGSRTHAKTGRARLAGVKAMADDLTIKLDTEQRARLEALAAETQQDAAELASRAVAEFVDYEAEFRAAVQEGVAASMS